MRLPSSALIGTATASARNARRPSSRRPAGGAPGRRRPSPRGVIPYRSARTWLTRNWVHRRPSTCSMNDGGNGPVPPRALEASGHPAHHLDPAGHHQVVVARRHAGRGEVHGLLGRAALAVDRRGRHRLGQPGRHPAVAGDVRALLPHLADAPADDVVDAAGIHPGPLDQRGQGEAQEVGRVPVGQRPAPLAEGRAHDVDDDRFPHVVASSSFAPVPRT